MRRALIASCAFVLVARAAAADDIVRGAVVKVEHQEIYVNVGDVQGVGDGASLRIKRTINLRHPVSRAAITDWVPVGSATVTQAGGRLSRAVVGRLIDAIRVGDVVEVLLEQPETPAPRPTTATPATPQPAAPPVDPATADVLAAFAAQSGLSLDARIAGWERYLSTHGGSKFATAIRADLESLHALREQMQPVAAGSQNEYVDRVEHLSPTEADAGEAVPVVFVLARPDRVASAYLHYRPRGRRTYTRALLVREHEIYLRGSLPGEIVKTPGVDYFVEISTPNGRSGLALGSPVRPIQIEVKPPPLADRFGAEPDRTSVTVSAEALDFATFDQRDGNRRDWMVSGNLDVAYRLDTVVQRIGIGYGVIAGAGGSEDVVWDTASPIPRTGFHYGNADIEIGRHDVVVGGKVIAGVGKRGFGMGIEGRGRFGERDGTNLTVRVLTIPEIGWLTDVRLGARPAGQLQLGVTVGATNQPNENDVAAKLGTELEWVRYENVSVLVRGSWQGRSTAHGGLGGGTAIRFTW